MKDRRRQLGGYLPEREPEKAEELLAICRELAAPAHSEIA